MNFEQLPIEESVPIDEAERSDVDQPSVKKSNGNGVSNFIKKTAALAGVAGISFFGNIGESNDESSPESGPSDGHRIEHKEESANSNRIESTDLFQVLHEDQKATWGVEFVNKINKAGKSFLAQRLVKINKDSSGTSVLGEYDTITQAAEEVSKLKDVPERVKKFFLYDVKVVEAEKEFQRSGLVEPSGIVVGKTHIEERPYVSGNIKMNNKVEVDEKGNVVKLVEARFLDK